MLHIVTFCTSDLQRSAKRLEAQARKLQNLASFTIYDETILEGNCALKKITNKHSRGFGLWSWKPFVIQKALANIPSGGILLYLDVGCEINVAGQEKLKEYIEDLDQTVGILPFRAVPPDEDILETNFNYDALIEKKWTKLQLFQYFDVASDDRILSSPQFGAGIIFLKKTNFTIKFVSHWCKVMSSRPELYDDVSFINEQSLDFVQSRHDQSVFSLLCKIHKLDKFRSAYEYFHPRVSPFWDGIPIGDWERLKSYPIHAKRNKDYGILNNILKFNFPIIKCYVKAFLKFIIRRPML